MLALLAFASVANSAPNITGDWITADRSAVVRITSCGIHECGTVVRVLARGPAVPRTDVNNPDAALRSRPFVGLKVFSGFTAEASAWVNGRAYDPKTGRTYNAKLSRNSDGTLTVTGCVLFICRSQRWIRIDAGS
jgi:uncharacterized protein (DUF2147 family)